MCRPLKEERLFCLGLSKCPVSEIVRACLNPGYFISHYFVVMISREVAFVLIALSITYFGVRIPLQYMSIGVSCLTHFSNKQLFTSVFTMLFLLWKLTRVCLYPQQTSKQITTANEKSIYLISTRVMQMGCALKITKNGNKLHRSAVVIYASKI